MSEIIRKKNSLPYEGIRLEYFYAVILGMQVGFLRVYQALAYHLGKMCSSFACADKTGLGFEVQATNFAYVHVVTPSTTFYQSGAVLAYEASSFKAMFILSGCPSMTYSQVNALMISLMNFQGFSNRIRQAVATWARSEG